jgi:hypothetical protein
MSLEGTQPDGDYPAKELFAGRAPREVLERLMDGDPLELWGRCRDRLESQALLLAPDRLYLRLLARVAHAAPDYRGVPPLSIWIADRLSASVRELTSEDQEDERRDLYPDSASELRYQFLIAALGIEPQLARQACVAFNSQPYNVRRAFYSIVFQRVPLNRFVAEGNGTPVQVKGHLRRAARALGLEDRPWPWQDQRGGRDDR